MEMEMVAWVMDWVKVSDWGMVVGMGSGLGLGLGMALVRGWEVWAARVKSGTTKQAGHVA